MDHLSPGLHGKAERSARGTTVYLVPGLTGGQRRAALRRLRQEGSRGCGPVLPGADLTVALAADRFRVGLRNTGAVIRHHPAGSLLPTAVAGLLMTLFVLASVSARMSQVPPPAAGGPDPASVQPTMVGWPALAQKSQPGGHGGAHKAGAGAASWSLTASAGMSTAGGGAGTRRGRKHGTGKTCGPADERSPATGQYGSCAPKARAPKVPAPKTRTPQATPAPRQTQLPWPPPPGGWPHWWRPEQDRPAGGGINTGVQAAGS